MNSGSYLLKKRKRDYPIKDSQIYDERNKITIFKHLPFLLNEVMEKTEEEKIEEDNYKKLIAFLGKKKVDEVIDKNKFSKWAEINDISNVFLKDKNEYGFLLTYKQNCYETLFIYKTPKILGQIFNEKLIIDLCYTNIQSNNALIREKDLDVETYAILNDSKDFDNIINKNVEFLKARVILYILNNKIKFNLDSLLPDNLFVNYKETSEKEKPISINLGYFYYFDIMPASQKEYYFIKSSNRKDLNNKLIEFILSPEKTTFYMTGVCGIGKSSSLIYFSSLNIFHIFYFNFKSIFKQKEENTKKIIKYEIMRFFSLDYKSDNDIIKSINNLVNNINIENLQDFLNNLVKYFLDFYGQEREKVLILDQYFEKIKGFDLNIFLSEIKENQNFKIIISTSLDNDFTKEGINHSLNYENNTEFKMHFYSNLLSDIRDTCLMLEKEENEQIKKELIKYGNIPKYYYLLKESNNQKLESINTELEKDIKLSISKDISLIIEIICLIKNNYIFNSNNIKDMLNIFFLKNISITKRNIYYIYDSNINAYIFYKDSKYKDKIKVSKLYEKFLIYYINNEKQELTDAINEHFYFDDFPEDILNIDFNPEKKIGNKIYNKFFEHIMKYKNNNMRHMNGIITIYKLDFIFPYIEVIFYKIIYDFINYSINNLSYLISLGSEGGIFEILVTYDILSKQKLLDISITDFIKVKSLVPVNYSLKFFSHRQKAKLFLKGKKNKINYDIEKLIGEKSTNKINLEKKGILIIQENTNGKYYDIGILIPLNDEVEDKEDDENNAKIKFILLLLQISINKPREKWLLYTEHEINFYFVKKKLESIYNIEITSGYFYYILKKENGKIIDTNTYNNNTGKCLLYDIEKGFSNDIKHLLNTNSFITKRFRLFNESTLIKSDKLSNNILTTKINAMLMNTFKTPSEIVFKILKENIRNENEDKSVTKRQFHIIGNDDMLDNIQDMTAFFIFLQKKDNILNIYITGKKKEVITNMNSLSINTCIVSDYEVILI